MVVHDFLPLPVAHAALAALHGAPGSSWDAVEAKHDVGRKTDGAGSTQHRYSCMGEADAPAAGDAASSSGEPLSCRIPILSELQRKVAKS